MTRTDGLISGHTGHTRENRIVFDRNLESISSTFMRAFFVKKFGAKTKMYLEKAAKKEVHTKKARKKR